VKYKHQTWRKLYIKEEGAFAKLPFTARAYAKQLMLLCDGAGRIHVGNGDDCVKLLVETAGFRIGATRGDRRMMSTMFPMLFEEGYLVHRSPYVVIRNFVAAQRKWSDDEEQPPGSDDSSTIVPPSSNEAAANPPRTGNEAATTEQRPSNDGATNGERTGNEPTTEQELSTLNHSDDVASAHTRALSSDLSSSDLSSFEMKGVQGEQQQPIDKPETDPAITPASGDASAPHKKTKRRKPKAPAPEVPIPEPGTVARSVYDAIVNDPILGPITAGPADFAVRITHPDAYPGVNVLAEVLRAAEHYARGKRVYTDGRRTLANWLRGEAEKEASRPKPTPNQLALGAKKTKGPLDPAPASKFTRPGESYDPFSLYNADGSPKGATQ